MDEEKHENSIREERLEKLVLECAEGHFFDAAHCYNDSDEPDENDLAAAKLSSGIRLLRKVDAEKYTDQYIFENFFVPHFSGYREETDVEFKNLWNKLYKSN